MNQVSEKIENKEWYSELFSKFESGLNGHSKTHLHTLRKSAIEQFREMGFPTQRNEEWKYTSVAPLLKYNFVPADPKKMKFPSKDVIEKYRINNLEVSLFVFVNGVYSSELSKPLPEAEKIEFENLSSAVLRGQELVEKHLGSYVKTDNGFTALNTAFTFDGAFIRIPDGTVLENPVHLLFLSGSDDSEMLSQPRNLIVAGKNSQVHIIESFHGISDTPYLLNSVTEIVMEENAIINFDRIQNESDSAFHVNRTHVQQYRSSNFMSHVITMSGSIVRNDLISVLSEPGSEAHFYGLYLVDGKRHTDNHTLIDHAAPHCHSNELYKGILDGKSRGVFNGKVIVRKDAQKTLAYQSNKNLLLSHSAKIDTKPQLEIFADDVKCSHGATVGQLDMESLFYLRSRGIGKDIARSILIKAFASDVIDEMENTQLRDSLNEQILHRLHQVSI